jgi:hypothetical protein
VRRATTTSTPHQFTLADTRKGPQLPTSSQLPAPARGKPRGVAVRVALTASSGSPLGGGTCFALSVVHMAAHVFGPVVFLGRRSTGRSSSTVKDEVGPVARHVMGLARWKANRSDTGGRAEMEAEAEERVHAMAE